MFHIVKATEIPWIIESADLFKQWLLKQNDYCWTEESLQSLHIYGSTTPRICYENIWEWHFDDPWFQKGNQAFGLLALDREEKIEILESENDELFIKCPDGTILPMQEFLNGESVSLRHDPDFSDLDWDPVTAMVHILSEYDDS